MAATGRGMTQAHLSKPDVSSFPERLYLMSLTDPRRTGPADWLWGVFGFLKDAGEMNKLSCLWREEKDLIGATEP